MPIEVQAFSKWRIAQNFLRAYWPQFLASAVLYLVLIFAGYLYVVQSLLNIHHKGPLHLVVPLLVLLLTHYLYYCVHWFPMLARTRLSLDGDLLRIIGKVNWNWFSLTDVSVPLSKVYQLTLGEGI